MTVTELKDVCRVYGLPISRNKPDLIIRLILFIKGLVIDAISTIKMNE